MTRLFCFLALLFLFSCSNSNADKKTATNISDTIKVSKTDTVPTAKEISSVSTRIDSIDKSNSSTIAADDKKYIQKAMVSKSDSLIWLTANMKLDHRIFGYEKPDTASRKMILISIFTNDVEGNPFKCPFGSYYQTSNMENIRLKYVSQQGQFIKANVINSDTIQGSVYIEKKWIEFDE